MTKAEFIAFYPQFAGFEPAVVLNEYIALANRRFSDFGDDTGEARRLYTAHRLTLYAKTALPDAASSSGLSGLAAAGSAQQKLSSKKVGEVSVSYSSDTSSATTSLADLTETTYGLQLLTLLRLHSLPVYVP